MNAQWTNKKTMHPLENENLTMQALVIKKIKRKEMKIHCLLKLVTLCQWNYAIPSKSNTNNLGNSHMTKKDNSNITTKTSLTYFHLSLSLGKQLKQFIHAHNHPPYFPPFPLPLPNEITMEMLKSDKITICNTVITSVLQRPSLTLKMSLRNKLLH